MRCIAKDADCHTSDIGHWFAMTAHFPAVINKTPRGAKRIPRHNAGYHETLAYPILAQRTPYRIYFNQPSAECQEELYKMNDSFANNYTKPPNKPH